MVRFMLWLLYSWREAIVPTVQKTGHQQPGEKLLPQAGNEVLLFSLYPVSVVSYCSSYNRLLAMQKLTMQMSSWKVFVIVF
jgi:hypothetical protein